MATKPVHEFTRANIPIINAYCGLNISTETEPGSLGPTSTWTPTPRPPTTTWPSTTKLPPTMKLPQATLEFATATEKEICVNVNTTNILLHATTAKAESSDQEEQLEPAVNDSPTVSHKRYTINHSEEVNGLRTLIIYCFLIVNRLI